MMRSLVACFLLSCVAHAAIALVQPALGGTSTCVAGTCSGSGTGTKSVTTLSTPTVGNVIIVGMESTVTPTCTDNQSPANIYIGQSFTQASSGATILIASVVTATGTFTVTCNNTGGHTNLVVSEWSGLTTYFDGVNWGAGLAASAYNCGAITTSNTNDLIVDFESDDGSGSGGTFTPTTSFTMLAGQTNAAGSDTAGMEYRIVSSTGTYTQGPKYSSQTNSSSCMTVAFKASPITTYSGTITKIQSTKSVNTGTASFGATPTVGNVVLIGVGSAGANGVTCKDNQSPSNPYAGNSYWRQTPNGLAAVFMAPVIVASGTFTITCSVPAGNVTIYIAEYAGLLPQYDTIANGRDTTPYACGTLTTTNANDILVALAEDPGNATNPANTTAGTGFTLLDSQDNGTLSPKISGIEFKIVSATGSTSPAMSSTGQTATNNCAAAALIQGSLTAPTGRTVHRVIAAQ